jgi:chemotaxis protein CheY-P-specific phosphatase CheC
MATEEQKKKNVMRLMTLMIGGMAKALYDMFGETAFATMTEVGKTTLEIMENEMGLEVDGENPKDVLTEIGRIFADEMGFIESFETTEDGNKLTLVVNHCQGWDLTQSILKTGVEIPFTCPIMNVCQAALSRMGRPVQKSIAPIPETRGSAITFTLIDS